MVNINATQFPYMEVDTLVSGVEQCCECNNDITILINKSPILRGC